MAAYVIFKQVVHVKSFNLTQNKNHCYQQPVLVSIHYHSKTDNMTNIIIIFILLLLLLLLQLLLILITYHHDNDDDDHCQRHH
jgi:hypothetical protein